MELDNVYLVGGAVRDELLGLPAKDRDYVVVGSTPESMEALGFRRVGKDFPVFLHPQTKEEYALARTERKNGQGYKGFAVYAEPDVTLEQDLGRRDLTINAMAQSATGELIDPYGGKADLDDGILRHVNPAAFMEDPVRILRLARFAARYQGFTVAQETMSLVCKMVSRGDVSHLVAERVWQEIAKGLMEKAPERMFELLHTTGALKVLLPELDVLWGVPAGPVIHHPEIDAGIHVMMVLAQAVKVNAPLEVRFAALLHDVGKGVTPKSGWPSHHDHETLGLPLVEAVCSRLKVPSECRSLALMACGEHTKIHQSAQLKKSTLIKLMERTDAFRRPRRFESLLQVCECDARGRLGLEDRAYPQRAYVTEALLLARSVNTGEVAAMCSTPAVIAQRIHEERVRRLNLLADVNNKAERVDDGGDGKGEGPGGQNARMRF